MSKVTVLQDGYAYIGADDKYKVRATSTLIENKSCVIVVDPGGAWETEGILAKLKENNITPDLIHLVVGTHGHSDHIGNLNLFPNVKHIVGHDMNVKEDYDKLFFNEPYVVVPNEIEIVATPGHTKTCISVIVRNDKERGILGVCGDLFECENDAGAWETISEDVETHKKSREQMKQLCDYIVPGHGCMFKVVK